jgi:hypothetical protein
MTFGKDSKLITRENAPFLLSGIARLITGSKNNTSLHSLEKKSNIEL